MGSLVLSRYTTVSALGRGNRAALAALRAGRSGLRPCDYADVDLPSWIGRVEGLESEPLPQALAGFDCRNNRLAQAALASDGFAEAVAAARARYGAGRIGLFVGTSTSGIRETEQAFAARAGDAPLAPEYCAHYPGRAGTASLADFCRAALAIEGPAMVISTACSSSAKVFAAAQRHIDAGLCDAAVVGGADSLCLSTLYGFNALELVSASPCRPWDRARNGISIGEAAGFALLEPAARAEGAVALLGYGESSDAFHMSTPHPEGHGAAEAMAAALARAGLRAADIDYVNLHGTATPANDASEDAAIVQVLGRTVPCSSTKGWTGHTLGAAGITEAVFCALALEHGYLPGTLNTEAPDPRLEAALQLAGEPRALRRVLSNSLGFGGTNCALALGRRA